jgi:hypothetical protein
MIDRATATAIARDAVAALKSTHPLALQEDRTLERPFGWVFFYTTREHLATGDWRKAAPGVAPLIIDRRDGSVHSTGTRHPVEYYIQEYERTHPSAGEAGPPRPVG